MNERVRRSTNPVELLDRKAEIETALQDGDLTQEEYAEINQGIRDKMQSLSEEVPFEEAADYGELHPLEQKMLDSMGSLGDQVDIPGFILSDGTVTQNWGEHVDMAHAVTQREGRARRRSDGRCPRPSAVSGNWGNSHLG